MDISGIVPALLVGFVIDARELTDRILLRSKGKIIADKGAFEKSGMSSAEADAILDDLQRLGWKPEKR
jgi:hypothetical protein